MHNIKIYDINLKITDNPYYCSKIAYVLFKLQKKIYEASKQCNLSLVHGLQKLLISLSSIQLLARNKIYQNAFKYNTIKKLYKIQPTNEQLTSKILKEEINKKIIYWLLEAEWKAKIQFNSKVQKHIFKKIELMQNIAYFKKIFYLEFKQIVYSKHIQIQYLISKLQSFNLVNQYIINILEAEYNIYIWNETNKFKKQDFISIHLLFNLLSEIIYICFRWSIFRNVKTNNYNWLLSWEIVTTPIQILYFDQSLQNLYQTQLIIQNLSKEIDFPLTKIKICYVKNLNDIFYFNHILFTLTSTGTLKFFQIKPNIMYIKNFTKSIKNNIYHKNKFSKIRANTNIRLQSLTDKLNFHFQIYQQFLSKIVDKSYLLRIAYIIDEIIYRWMKKKYSSKINNKFLYKLSH